MSSLSLTSGFMCVQLFLFSTTMGSRLSYCTSHNCSCSCARSTADPAWYDEWWCCVYSAVFTSAWNCSRGPNAQSNGIHPKESPTVYSDLADRIDTPLYGKTEHYQMTEDVPSNQQRISARMTGCDDWRAAASATGFGDNER